MDMLLTYLSDLPVWLLAAIVLAVGWLTAGVARFVIPRALDLLRFNRLCARIGLCEFLRKGEVSATPAALVGRGAYWAIFAWMLLEAASLLDVAVASHLRQRAVAAFPSLVSALLILGVGLLAVAFLAAFVRTLARNAGSPYATLLGRVTRWSGGLLILAVAIEQAGIHGYVLAGILYIVLAGFALGMALAFGLGCKDLARQAMEKWVAELKERHRDASRPDLEG